MRGLAGSHCCQRRGLLGYAVPGHAQPVLLLVLLPLLLLGRQLVQQLGQQ